MSDLLTRIVMLKERVGGEMILVVVTREGCGQLVNRGR